MPEKKKFRCLFMKFIIQDVDIASTVVINLLMFTNFKVQLLLTERFATFISSRSGVN